MNGLQKQVTEALRELLMGAESGKYGQNNDFDVDVFLEDLNETADYIDAIADKEG